MKKEYQYGIIRAGTGRTVGYSFSGRRKATFTAEGLEFFIRQLKAAFRGTGAVIDVPGHRKKGLYDFHIYIYEVEKPCSPKKFCYYEGWNETSDYSTRYNIDHSADMDKIEGIARRVMMAQNSPDVVWKSKDSINADNVIDNEQSEGVEALREGRESSVADDEQPTAEQYEVGNQTVNKIDTEKHEPGGELGRWVYEQCKNPDNSFRGVAKKSLLGCGKKLSPNTIKSIAEHHQQKYHPNEPLPARPQGRKRGS